jgi:ubiquinone/menaquinone biosynthesis C-methylase UbiE
MTDAFSTKAAQWDANPVRAAIGKAFYGQVLKTLTTSMGGTLAGKTVLDFGCGTGTLGLRLALEHAARPIFVDASPAMLDVLRAKLAELHLLDAQVVQSGAAPLPVAPGSVALIVSLMALHHIEKTEDTLRSLRGLLAPGGLLLLGDLLTEDGNFHGSPGDPPAAHNGFDPEELRGLCARLGFTVLRLRLFHLVNKPDATGADRDYPLFFLAAQAA